VEENAVHPWWKHPLSSLVASERAGGLVRAPTWFLLGYLLFLITPALYSERGIFADTGFLWFAQSFFLGAALLACLGESLVYLKVGCAFFGVHFSINRARIKNGSRRSTDIIFARPDSIVARQPKFTSPIDVPPMLLSDPVGVIDHLEIAIDDKAVRVEDCRLQMIGFDRYRVKSCQGLVDQTWPHVSVRLSGDEEVYLIGRFTGRGGIERQNPNSPLIIVQADQLDKFVTYNMARLLLLSVLVAFQMLTY
jgi:hypothetical protein